MRGGNANANGRARYRDEDSVHLDDEEAKRKRDSEDLNEWEEMEQKVRGWILGSRPLSERNMID
jgi:hypothetical protein